jgi:hypothetical protein
MSLGSPVAEYDREGERALARASKALSGLPRLRGMHEDLLTRRLT